MDPFLGQTILFAGNFAPRGWAYCEGQLLPINQYQALFSILGTTYGGDGRTTFALPDLRGRAPVSQGSGAGLPTYTLGQRGGNASTTLLTQNLPAAQINILATTNDATGTEPSGAIRGVTDDALPAYTSGANTNMKDGAIAGAANLSFSNEPPFLALNYIIALQGVFPSRN